jgi:hypothetical protein
MAAKKRLRYGIPVRLLTQIGRIAVASAYLEQEIKLWASALLAQNTAGIPAIGLERDFKRLRRMWFNEARKRLTPAELDKIVNPINSDLAILWKVRGMIIHGRWKHAGGDVYVVDGWEQRERLRHWSYTYSLAEVQEVADRLLAILAQLYAYFDQVALAPSPYKPRARPSAPDRQSGTISPTRKPQPPASRG